MVSRKGKDKGRIHDSIVNSFFFHPELLGLEGKIIIAKECRLINEDGRLVAEPDILAIVEGRLCLAEIKSTHSATARRKAIEQLQRASRYLDGLQNMGGYVRRLYVGGNHPYEEI